MRSTPSERPRSAMSTSNSLIGLRPARGAYLFSSSRRTKRSGSRLAPCFNDSLERVASSLRRSSDNNRAAAVLMGVGVPGQLNADALLDKADLSAPVFVFGEAEAQKTKTNEVPGRPAVSADFAMSA